MTTYISSHLRGGEFVVQFNLSKTFLTAVLKLLSHIFLLTQKIKTLWNQWTEKILYSYPSCICVCTKL